jgi:hypothetical protein
VRVYERINALPPAGNGGPSAAAFQVDDAQHAREQDH